MTDAPVSVPTYNNRIALDIWTIERVIALAGSNVGLAQMELPGDTRQLSAFLPSGAGAEAAP